MPLEKYENLLELSVKQLSKFNFPMSDYVWCVKKQMLMLFVAKFRYFSYLARVIHLNPFNT